MTARPSAARGNSFRRDDDVRRAWVFGGSLLIASALVPAVVPAGALPALHYVSTSLHVVALVVFALGVRAQGSITARRPLGTVSLLALAAITGVWTFVVGPVVSAVLSSPDMTQSTDTTWWSILSTAELAVVLALSIIAVVQIARAGVVPRPWNVAPLWALVAVVLASAAAQAAGIAGLRDQGTLIALFAVQNLVHVVASVFLGILAIVLAVRRRPEAVPVYVGSAG